MNGRTPRAATVVAALMLILALAACGASGGGDGGQTLGGDEGVPAEGAAEQPASEERDADGEGAFGGGDGASDPGPLGAPIEQRIVKTGEITLEVEQIGSAVGRVRALAVELGGYVGGSQAGTLDDRATLTLRIPADRFDEALAELHAMDAEVIAEATREQDVTGQVADLGARIDNLRASETSYRELVARAERVEDILAVQSRLDEVRGQIEQLVAQLDVLESQAALSTLTITLVPREAPIEAQTEIWDPGAQLDRALASLVGIGQGLFDGVIWFVVVWLPILLVLGLLVLVALRGVLEVRRRLPPAASPLAGPATDDRAG